MRKKLAAYFVRMVQKTDVHRLAHLAMKENRLNNNQVEYNVYTI